MSSYLVAKKHSTLSTATESQSAAQLQRLQRANDFVAASPAMKNSDRPYMSSIRKQMQDRYGSDQKTTHTINNVLHELVKTSMPSSKSIGA